MRITNSQVSLTAQHQFASEQQHSFVINLQPAPTPSPSSEVEISPAARQQLTFNNMDQRVSLIKSLLENILGYEIKFWGFDEKAPLSAEQTSSSLSQAGFSIESTSTYSETEDTQFQAQGRVRTAEGQEIQFATELSLNRNYQTSSQIYAGNLSKPKKDPLVINYAAAAATLSDKKFNFDLSNDGTTQQISLLKQGSAFLALDRNGDGKINQGSELFGAQSGDGFADLAQYDEDKNGWIDEGDSLFAKLKLWIKDDTGKEQLLNLKDKGIGALFLGHAQTRFDLNNAQNSALGQIRSSGIFLRDDGSGGGMQQIDLVV